MTGLDTNILLRYITQDDPLQSPAATRFIEEHCTPEAPGFVNHLVLCELVWVLRRCYQASQPDALAVIEQILRTEQLEVQQPQIVWKALRFTQRNAADFPDSLISQINQAHDCRTTLTFDQGAAVGEGMTLLPS